MDESRIIIFLESAYLLYQVYKKYDVSFSIDITASAVTDPRQTITRHDNP